MYLIIWSLRSNSVTRQVNFHWTKIGGKCQNGKIQLRHFGRFSNIWGKVFMRRSHQRVHECILKMVENVYLYVFDDVLDVTYLMTLLAPHLVGDLGIPQAKLKINENQSRNVFSIVCIPYTYPKKLLIQRGSQAKLSCYFFSIQWTTDIVARMSETFL